ncbi:unnamed protein product, partial [Ectocarpus fasciculatus]
GKSPGQETSGAGVGVGGGGSLPLDRYAHGCSTRLVVSILEVFCCRDTSVESHVDVVFSSRLRCKETHDMVRSWGRGVGVRVGLGRTNRQLFHAPPSSLAAKHVLFGRRYCEPFRPHEGHSRGGIEVDSSGRRGTCIY